MPTRAEVLASKIQQYDAQITDEQNADIDNAIAKLATAQLASGTIGGGGGGGGTGDASAANQIAGNTSLSSINTKLPALGQATPAASSPVVLPAAQITALTPPTNTGYSTSALQIDGNTALTLIEAKTPSLGQALVTASTPVVLPVEQIAALTPPSNTGYALDTTVNSLLKPASTLAEVTVLGSITNSLPAGTNSIGQVIANAGTNLNTSLLALEGGGNLASINTKTPAQGQALETDSSPVVLPATQIIALTPPTNTGYSTSALQTTGNTALTLIEAKTPSPDKVIILGFTSTAAINNNLLDSSGAGVVTDVRAFGMADIYISATTSTGQIAFVGALNAAFTESVTNLPYLDLTLGNTTSGLLATVVGVRRYQINLSGISYLRVGLTTAAAGCRAVAVFRTSAYIPAQNNVTVAANQSIAVSSSQMAPQGALVADVAVSVLSATATTAGFTPTWGISNIFSVSVSALTLAPTLDVTIQESPDNGLTWRTCYVFPRITALGTYNSPLIAQAGRQIRYVQTLGGTGTITRFLGRTQSNLGASVGSNVFTGASVLSTVSEFLLPANSKVRAIYFTNNSASVVYLQIHESGAALTTASVPLIPSIRVEANTTRTMTQSDLGTLGTIFGPNTRVGLSSTFGVYTAIPVANLPSMGLVIDTITI